MRCRIVCTKACDRNSVIQSTAFSQGRGTRLIVDQNRSMESAMKESSLSPRQWAFVVVTGGAACALPFVQSTKKSDEMVVDYRSASDFGSQTSEDPITLADIAPPEPEKRLPEWASNQSPFDDLAPPALASSIEEFVIAPLQPIRPWISGPTESAANLPEAVASTAPANPQTRGPAVASTVNSVNSVVNPAMTTASNSVFQSGRATHEVVPEWKDQTPFAASGDDKTESVDRWPDQRNIAADSLPSPLSDPHRGLVSALVETETNLTRPAPVGPTRRATLKRNPMAQSIATHRPFGQHASPVNPTQEMSPAQPLPALPPERKERIIFQPSLRKQH